MALGDLNDWRNQTLDTKPEVTWRGDVVEYNKSKDNVQITKFGFGDKNTISLYGGGIFSYIEYTDSNSETQIPMPASGKVAAWMHNEAGLGSGTLKITDYAEKVQYLCNNGEMVEPQSMTFSSDSPLMMTIRGNAYEFLPL